jgi:predicted amidophosphoribosyltransferase
LKGKQRRDNLRKAFSLADDYKDTFKSHKERGRIWVIDDISTTGATLRHACKAMRQINQPVSAFSFTRTLHD